MRKIFSHPVTPLALGLCLRLLFVLKFPATSGDTVLYEQMATNWLRHGTYAMEVDGAIQPVDLRMPGYPAYLVAVYWLTGKIGEAAGLWVMLGQIAVDLLGCLAIAQLAKILAGSGNAQEATSKRARLAALWLAALCPFTANYCAVRLTEVFAVLLTALTCCGLVVATRRVSEPAFRIVSSHARVSRSVEYTALGAGFIGGIGTLFRPETPLVLLAGGLMIAWRLAARGMWKRIVWTGLAMALGLLGPLIPWGARNLVTLNEPQFLAPANSNLPGELVPNGFMQWERTWLYRMKDCYLVPWKLNGEAIDAETIPARAFDTPEEKQRVTMILTRYNDELTLTKEEDEAFGQLARERTSRHPLRTYLALPALRALTMWFSPRIELLPVSGAVFPLKQAWEEDKIDLMVTMGLFVLSLSYLGLGIWGAVKVWRIQSEMQMAVLMLAAFVVVRTAFLTTLETPEPRYVLECFPALMALGAAGLAARMQERSAP